MKILARMNNFIRELVDMEKIFEAVYTIGLWGIVLRWAIT